MCHIRVTAESLRALPPVFSSHLYTYLNFCNLFVFLRFTRNLPLKFPYLPGKRMAESRVYLLMGGVYVFF
jgi:hypothetical protein